MSLASAVARGRAAAEARMTDSGVAKRPTGTAYNAGTDADETTYATLFTSRCEVQAYGETAQTEEAGARTAAVARVVVKFPASTAALLAGDVITVTPGTGSLAAAVSYEVVGPFEGTHKTARRYYVERVAS